MADGLDDVAHGRVVEDSDRPGGDVGLVLLDREDILALGDAIEPEAERAGAERDAIGQGPAACESGRCADDDQGLSPPVQLLARDDDDRMRPACSKSAM